MRVPDSELPADALDALFAEALEAQKAAYAPYSRFRVGAAVLLRDGTVLRGCNVENASYGATICAERTAMVSAVARFGPAVRDSNPPIAVAVVGPTREPLTPCGVCRQFLAEFNPRMVVACATQDLGKRLVLRLEELLPHRFDGDDLPEG